MTTVPVRPRRRRVSALIAALLIATSVSVFGTPVSASAELDPSVQTPTFAEQRPATTSTTVRFYPMAPGLGVRVSHLQVRTMLVRKDGRVPTQWVRPAGLQHFTSRSFAFSVERGATRCAQVRAVDLAGNTTDWSYAQCRTLFLDDRDVPHEGAWAMNRSDDAYLGTLSRTSQPGASLVIDNVTDLVFHVKTNRCPSCGWLVISTSWGEGGDVSLRSPTFESGATIPIIVGAKNDRPKRVRFSFRFNPGDANVIDGIAVDRAQLVPYEAP